MRFGWRRRRRTLISRLKSERMLCVALLCGMACSATGVRFQKPCTMLPGGAEVTVTLPKTSSFLSISQRRICSFSWRFRSAMRDFCFSSFCFCCDTMLIGSRRPSSITDIQGSSWDSCLARSLRFSSISFSSLSIVTLYASFSVYHWSLNSLSDPRVSVRSCCIVSTSVVSCLSLCSALSLLVLSSSSESFRSFSRCSSSIARCCDVVYLTWNSCTSACASA
mmetsp:Transcript_22736/g.89914  ORF Transcript_22736/g.89914 Transcript_22736/m.89914 type:complete len:222 (+) Transcript_22736:669-1334(+)